ncbi:MAG: leucine-rich repeat domain-containing protein [Clostridia bacterium]|nr:leucine-rich repeat domain-containing protein [Clostridia bacterium]
MKKKIISLLLTLSLILLSAPLTDFDFGGLFFSAEAATGYISGDYEYTVYKNNDYEDVAWILKYSGSEKDIVIPETLDGYTVEAIEVSCFEDNQALESVIFPNTVKAIYENAFKNCKNLKSVKFPDTPVALDNYCFYGCESLEEVTINLDLSYKVVWYIGKGVFEDSGVKKINLAEGLGKFPARLLDGTLVEEIELPKSVEYFMEDAFENSICETVIAKGLITPPYNDNWTHNKTENGHIDKIIYYQPPAVSGDGNEYFSRYDSENGYWVCEYFVGWEEDEIDFIYDGGFTYTVIKETGEANLWEYTGEETELIIPAETPDGNPVVAIHCESFSKNKNLKKVVIPSSVKTIGVEAFKNCITLEEIIIPDSVEIIGDEAFLGCTSLKNIDYPPMDYIPIGAFSRCSSLTEFFVPETVKAIGSYAFGSCTSLSSVTLNEGLKEIGYSAFGKARLGEDYPCISEITLPESLEYIGKYAFQGLTASQIEIPEKVKEIKSYTFQYSKISEIIFNEGLEKIGYHAFHNCSSLEKINLPDTVKYIDDGAFKSCKNVKSIELSPLVTEICNGAFSSIHGLENIVIPSTIKVIGESAFAYCRNLKSVIIENGVEEIGKFAFSYCTSIEEITIPESIKTMHTNILYDSQVKTLNYNAKDAVMLPTGGISLLYASDIGVINFGNNVKTVPDHFAANSDIERINLPDSIEHIGESAFSDCRKLTEINLPKNVKTIGDFAFYNCDLLTEVLFPDTVISLGERAFGGCDGLTQITLPKNVETVGKWAFYNCDSATEITIPENVRSFSQHAFQWCDSVTMVNINAVSCTVVPETTSEELPKSPFISLKNLKNINIGDTVKELPSYLFSSVDTIDVIVLPDSVTDIGAGAFANSSISSLENCKNLESIEEYAFINCKNLSSFDFGNELMLIGMEAFKGCTDLKNVYISDSVVNIEIGAFSGCPSLESVRMSPNVDYIPREAFYNCKELSTFIWDAESKLVGRLAFGNCVKLVDFDFLNVEKLYVNSFLGSGVTVVQLGESENEASPTPLTTIEVQSFKDCGNLATLGIGGNVTTIKTQAFADCTNLETAVIADSVTEIADDAFDGCDKLTIYCSENSYAHLYAQSQGIRVSTFVIAPIPNQTYTGFEIEPEISVSASGDKLAEDIDFGVTYTNNINVGNADVTVKGKGDFRMFASKANFAIVTKNISAVTVAPIADQPYTGSSVTPEITVNDGTIILREGTDYTVTYENNVNEGTATAKITGIGNWSGTASADFVISKEAEEPSLFDRIISSISSFFARIISFLLGIFM